MLNKTFISRLKTFEENLDDTVVNLMLKDPRYIIDAIQTRLLNTGIAGDGGLIGGGQYSAKTIKEKQKKGRPFAHFTLKDEGDWYGSMTVTKESKEIIVKAQDKSPETLIGRYGESILELTEAEINVMVEFKIDPLIQNMLDKFDTIEIKL